MFMGEYSHSLDAKGRLIIPAKFRESLEDRVVVTRSLDNCLYIYDVDSWEQYANKLAKLPRNTREQRELVRFFLSGAVEVELDKQGRILIPTNLRRTANIVKDVVLLGVGEMIEIWSKERWEETQTGDEVNAIAEKMLGSGFMI